MLWRGAHERGAAGPRGHERRAIDCGTPADYLAANLQCERWRVGRRAGGTVVEGRIERCVVWPGAHVGPAERLVDADPGRDTGETGHRADLKTVAAQLSGLSLSSAHDHHTAGEANDMEQIEKRLISWASVIEPKTLEQARRTAAMPFIYPHVALMPDAHLGMGATVGSVIPTLRRRDAGRRRRGHRLRHDRGPHPVRPRRPDRVGRSLAALRESIEAAVPLSAGAYNAKLDRDRSRPGSPSWRRGGRRAWTAIAGNWRLQLGTLGSRQPLHRGHRSTRTTGCGCSCTPGRVASATGSPSTTSRSPERPMRAVVDHAARPRPGLPGRGHRRVLGLHPRAALGAAVRPAQPRGDDGPGRAPACPRGSASRVVEAERINCHHNFTQQETPLRQGGVGVPQGRDRGPGRPAGPDPGLDGHRVVRRRAARATRSA